MNYFHNRKVIKKLWEISYDFNAFQNIPIREKKKKW